MGLTMLMTKVSTNNSDQVTQALTEKERKQ